MWGKLEYWIALAWEEVRICLTLAVHWDVQELEWGNEVRRDGNRVY